MYSGQIMIIDILRMSILKRRPLDYGTRAHTVVGERRTKSHFEKRPILRIISIDDFQTKRIWRPLFLLHNAM